MINKNKKSNQKKRTKPIFNKFKSQNKKNFTDRIK